MNNMISPIFFLVSAILETHLEYLRGTMILESYILLISFSIRVINTRFILQSFF